MRGETQESGLGGRGGGASVSKLLCRRTSERQAGEPLSRGGRAAERGRGAVAGAVLLSLVRRSLLERAGG